MLRHCVFGTYQAPATIRNDTRPGTGARPFLFRMLDAAYFVYGLWSWACAFNYPWRMKRISAVLRQYEMLS
jgi:hypothetical protein